MPNANYFLSRLVGFLIKRPPGVVGVPRSACCKLVWDVESNALAGVPPAAWPPLNTNVEGVLGAVAESDANTDVAVVVPEGAAAFKGVAAAPKLKLFGCWMLKLKPLLLAGTLALSAPPPLAPENWNEVVDVAAGVAAGCCCCCWPNVNTDEVEAGGAALGAEKKPLLADLGIVAPLLLLLLMLVLPKANGAVADGCCCFC